MIATLRRKATITKTIRLTCRPRAWVRTAPIAAAKRANVESGRFAPSFKLRHAAKDLRLVTETAASRGRDLKQARANRAWLEEAEQHDAADLDFSAVVATIVGQKLSTTRGG